MLETVRGAVRIEIVKNLELRLFNAIVITIIIIIVVVVIIIIIITVVVVMMMMMMIWTASEG